MELASLLRPLGVVAGPAAVIAFGLFIAGMVVHGEDALDGTLLATASSAAMLVTLLGIGAAALASLARLRDAGRSVASAAVAVLGSVLVAGGSWAALFVISALATEVPEALEADLVNTTIGFIASYAVFAVGWVWTGIALLRARLVPTWLGVATAVAGVIAFVPSPEPFRILFIGVVSAVLAHRLAAVVPEPAPEPLPA
jgi:hypothetical protein